LASWPLDGTHDQMLRQWSAWVRLHALRKRRKSVMKLHLVLAPPLSSATRTSGPTTPSDSDEQEPDRQTRGKNISTNHNMLCKISIKLQDQMKINKYYE